MNDPIINAALETLALKDAALMHYERTLKRLREMDDPAPEDRSAMVYYADSVDRLTEYTRRLRDALDQEGVT